MVVVIDALRADFVVDLEERNGRPKISWLTEALERGDGIAWVARASPPTVTLPRFYSFISPSDPDPHFTLRLSIAGSKLSPLVAFPALLMW